MFKGLLLCGGAVCLSAALGAVDVRIDSARPFAWQVPETLYGLFLEDISNGIDGGLYPELIFNRGFDFPSSDKSGRMPEGWAKDCRAGSACRATLAYARPKFANTPAYLHVEAFAPEAGVKNRGVMDELSVRAGVPLELRVWARGVAFRATLKDLQGKPVAAAELKPGCDWTLCTAVLVPDRDVKRSQFSLRTRTAGELDLEYVSLMPKNRAKCGLRKDVVKLMAELHPQTFRFPGGSNLDGHTFEEWFDWRRTLGPVEERRPVHGFFGYWQLMGMGYCEYLALADEIGAEPLPVILPGLTARCPKPEVIPMDGFGWMLTNALDNLELVYGTADTKWGRVRAEAGRPEPYARGYVGIGNEAWGTEYWERYRVIARAVREKYPDVKLVASLWPRLLEHPERTASEMKNVTPDVCDVIDEHLYPSPSWWLNHADRYDGYDRSGCRVYVGEWATRHADERYVNSVHAAVAEAAFRLGMERNSDVVLMSAFAPLVRREGSRNASYPPTPEGRPVNRYSLIQIDGTDSCGTPSYWVEKVFSDTLPERMVRVSYPVVRWTQPAGVDRRGWFYNPDAKAMEVVSLHAAAGWRGDALVVRLVNAKWAGEAVSLDLGLDFPAGRVVRTVVSGAPDAANRPCCPDRVRPVSDELEFAGGTRFELTLPSCSVTVLKLRKH